MKKIIRFLISISICCILVIIIFFTPKTFSAKDSIDNISVSYDSSTISLTSEQCVQITETLRTIRYTNRIGVINRIVLAENPISITCSINNKPMHLVIGELNIMYSDTSNLFHWKLIEADSIYEHLLVIIETK